MGQGTIVFVHGTGVRLKNYRRGFDSARERAASAGIEATARGGIPSEFPSMDCHYQTPLRSSNFGMRKQISRDGLGSSMTRCLSSTSSPSVTR